MEKILSVSIASYNVENYIKRALDSCCIPEIMDRLEVIVVNDGSTDHTLEIAKEYEEKYRKSVKEAEMEKSLEIAKNMLNDGMDIDKVARLTNLSLEEVAALR